MGRPAKATESKTGKIGNQAILDRKVAEKSLRGNTQKAVEPAYEITKDQKKIFRSIRKVLEEADVLGELDSYILTMTAVAVDRLSEIDRRVNADPALLTDKKTLDVRDKYMSHFLRGCNELCLSPQARAKISIAAAANKARSRDPLADLLADDD